MPYRDYAVKRAHDRVYQRGWRAERRAWLLELFFQNQCQHCGAPLTALSGEVHHIDPAEKKSHHIWSWELFALIRELLKCVLLCHECHAAETRKQNASKAVCGTAARYWRGCRCQPCKQAYSDYRRARREAQQFALAFAAHHLGATQP